MSAPAMTITLVSGKEVSMSRQIICTVGTSLLTNLDDRPLDRMELTSIRAIA